MRRFASWTAVCLFLWALPSAMAMEVMEDTGLSEVSAQTGITINATNLQGTATNAYWNDSDGFPGDPAAGYLVWQGITMGPINFNLAIDAGSDATRSYVRLASTGATDLGVAVNGVYVDNNGTLGEVGDSYSMGSVRSSLDLGPSYLDISGHDAAGSRGARLRGSINIYGTAHLMDSYMAWGDSDGATGFGSPGYLTLMGLDASLTFDGLEVDAGSDATYSWLNLDFPAVNILAEAPTVSISNNQAGNAAQSLGGIYARASIGPDFYLKIRGGGQSGPGLSVVGDISLVGGTSYLGWYDTDTGGWLGFTGINLTYAATDEFHLDVSDTWLAWRWPAFNVDVNIADVVTGSALDSMGSLRAVLDVPETEPGQARPSTTNVEMRFYTEFEFLATSDIGYGDMDGMASAASAGWITLHNAHFYGTGGTPGLSATMFSLFPVVINAGATGATVSLPDIHARLLVEDAMLTGTFDNGGVVSGSMGGLAARLDMPAITMNITTH